MTVLTISILNVNMMMQMKYCLLIPIIVNDDEDFYQEKVLFDLRKYLKYYDNMKNLVK